MLAKTSPADRLLVAIRLALLMCCVGILVDGTNRAQLATPSWISFVRLLATI
uniref:EamA/RhaT family transporter n=1 Tax=Macrostomum lignano TaxID=282301 RepID=A0A1I8FS27_9PLAT